jgi:hypothetical protein
VLVLVGKRFSVSRFLFLVSALGSTGVSASDSLIPLTSHFLRWKPFVFSFAVHGDLSAVALAEEDVGVPGGGGSLLDVSDVPEAPVIWPLSLLFDTANFWVTLNTI